jgi:hypothetical protein
LIDPFVGRTLPALRTAYLTGKDRQGAADTGVPSSDPLSSSVGRIAIPREFVVIGRAELAWPEMR